MINPKNYADEVVENSSNALIYWGQLTVKKRCGYLKNLRYEIWKNQDRIANSVMLDTNKPITEIYSQEITSVLEAIRFAEKKYPKWLETKKLRYLRPGFWRKANFIFYEPIGIISIIGPSTFPFLIPLMQASVSLLCGNCIILKPSEHCPRTSNILKDLFVMANFPDSVVKIIDGDKTAAQNLISNKQISKVIFTGSSTAGKEVAELCGKYFKPCVLELGGSGDAIICEDADIEMAAKCITWSSYYANGSSCVSTKKVFVHKNVESKFIENVKKQLNMLKKGVANSPDTDISSIGKNVPSLLITQNPTNLSIGEIMNKSSLIITQINSIDRAIDEINRSEYGLSVSIWTKNFRSSLEISKKLKVGMVWINDASAGMPNLPWGGVKKSGWGRLYSKESIQELVNIKSVSFDRQRFSKNKLWWFPYSLQKLELFKSVNKILSGQPNLNSIINSLKYIIKYKLNYKTSEKTNMKEENSG